jgi:hypothetical protein
MRQQHCLRPHGMLHATRDVTFGPHWLYLSIPKKKKKCSNENMPYICIQYIRVFKMSLGTRFTNAISCFEPGPQEISSSNALRLWPCSALFRKMGLFLEPHGPLQPFWSRLGSLTTTRFRKRSLGFRRVLHFQPQNRTRRTFLWTIFRQLWPWEP